jgi:hypothetical protein
MRGVVRGQLVELAMVPAEDKKPNGSTQGIYATRETAGLARQAGQQLIHLPLRPATKDTTQSGQGGVLR